jgi:lysylphosphatidylglycerol synthetase-like protein (DUF2156 family)/enterochelin esterase-like enzyme
MAKAESAADDAPAPRVWLRARNTYALAALMAAAALIPVLPEVPHQHLIVLGGAVRFNVLVAVAVVTCLLLGVVLRRAGPWWASIGIVAAAAADPTPPVGGTVGVFAIFPMVAFSGLIVAAGIATLRGTITSAYGVVIAVSSALASVYILQAGADPDISVTVALLLIVATAVLMGVIRARQRPPVGSMLELTAARQAYGNAQISACSDAGAKHAVVLPSGSYAPLRTALSVAVVGGDPIAVPGGMEQAIVELHEVCRSHGLIPCVFQARADLAQQYRKAGYRLMKFGEEAIVDLAEWDLTSSAMANVRHSVARASRSGLSAHTMLASELGPETWEQFERVSDRWRGRRFELGFSMRAVSDLVSSDALVNMVVDSRGDVVAFSSWHGLAEGVALDVLRRVPEAAPGAMDMCITSVLLDAQYRGVKWASLGSVPFRGETEDVKTRRIGRSCRRFLYNRGVSGYHYWTLSRFKAKFGARWESRMIAVGGGFSGVPLALAAIWLAHRRPAQDNNFVAHPVNNPESHAKGHSAEHDSIPQRLRQLWHKDPGLGRGERARRWVLSVVLAGLVTAVFLAIFGTTITQWLVSEGAADEIALLLATLAVVVPSAFLCALAGMGGWPAFAGTMSVFFGAYLIPFVSRAVTEAIAPQITRHTNPMGWVEVVASATLLSAIASGIGLLLGQSIRHGLRPGLRRARRSRVVIVAVVIAVLATGLGAWQVPNLLSAGPLAMVYNFQPNKQIAPADVVMLTVDGRHALMYKPAILRTYPSLSLPVVYFLHGQPGTEQDWLDSGADLPSILDQLIANKTIPPIIAVMPDGSDDHFADGVWSNTAQGQTSETWLVDRLMPAVAHQMHTLGGACTGIAGFSEGGFAATNIAIHYPTKFGFVASYSGYFEANRTAFGPATAANSPTITARQLNPGNRMPIFLGAGTTDIYRGPTEAFAQELSGLNWTPTMVAIVPGSHSMGTLRTLLAESLTWLGKTWRTSTSQQGTGSNCSPQF